MLSCSGLTLFEAHGLKRSWEKVESGGRWMWEYKCSGWLVEFSARQGSATPAPSGEAGFSPARHQQDRNLRASGSSTRQGHGWDRVGLSGQGQQSMLSATYPVRSLAAILHAHRGPPHTGIALALCRVCVRASLILSASSLSGPLCALATCVRFGNNPGYFYLQTSWDYPKLLP